MGPQHLHEIQSRSAGARLQRLLSRGSSEISSPGRCLRLPQLPLRTKRLFFQAVEGGLGVLIIDNARFIDPASWSLLSPVRHDVSLFVLMSFAPGYARTASVCQTAVDNAASQEFAHHHLDALTPSAVAQKVCQDLGVVSIPRDLARSVGGRGALPEGLKPRRPREGTDAPRKGSTGPLEASLALASPGRGLLVTPRPGKRELRAGNSLTRGVGRCQPFAVAGGRKGGRVPSPSVAGVCKGLGLGGQAGGEIAWGRGPPCCQRGSRLPRRGRAGPAAPCCGHCPQFCSRGLQ